ncbi:MAG: helix-turn-helix transcriptional regulator [Actinomycetota bacterium]|nr:helix-turn-helix transcriptional regulator [Actinomycetota bacterium]
MDGTKLRAARERKGLSQRELGEAVGAHQTTVSKIERLGWEPPKAMSEDMAWVLGVSVTDLAGDGSAPTTGGRSTKPGKPTTRPALAPADAPRVRELLRRARAQRRPGAPRPTHYRCPYCKQVTHTDVMAVRHAVACDDAYPGYTEFWGRYVDLSEAELNPSPLRAAAGAR